MMKAPHHTAKIGLAFKGAGLRRQLQKQLTRAEDKGHIAGRVHEL